MTPEHDNNTNTTRRRFRTLLAVIAALAMIIPGVAWASHTFTDVPDDNVFHDDIAAIQEAGVTLGCNPPDNTRYCPDDTVTRGQMAAFMNRLGALDDDKTPVINAAQLEGNTSDDFVTALEDTSMIERQMDFDLTGGAPEECVETSSLTFEPDFNVIHQLHATPDGIDPWDINVALNTKGKADGYYDVCFITLDGSNLPAGTYETFGIMTLP